MKQNRQKSIQKILPSTHNTKQILWNVLQPGDPYDIKKSMIAKLPQHPPRFMGQHLQLVCLFQAAQIERMTQYLDEMSIKIRQVQRVQLDRHSYEVQIKQLAQKLAPLNTIKLQNQKLKDFIKRQSQQMQSLQKHRHSSQNLIQLQTKYDKVLNQLMICRQYQSSLQKSKNDLLKQISDWQYKCEKNQKSLNQEKYKFQRQIQTRVDNAVNNYRISVENKQYQLKGQINVMKENLALKNRQIQLERSKLSSLSKQFCQKQQLLGKYIRGQIQTQGSKAQQVLKMSKSLQKTTQLLQQSQRQTISLKDEIQYLKRKCKSQQEENKKRQLDYKSQLQQHNGPQLLIKISQLEAKNKLLHSQMQRLNEAAEKKKKQSLEKDKDYIVLKERIILHQRKTQSLQKQFKQKDQRLRRFELQYQTIQQKDIKIQMMAKQISRLNMVLQEKIHQLMKKEHIIGQHNQSQNHHATILRSKDQTIKILQSRKRQYQMKMMSLQEANKLNFDQISRLNIKLANTQNQNIHLRRELDARVQSSTQLYKLQILKLNEQNNLRLIENRKLREDNEQMFNQINQLHENIKLKQNKCADKCSTLKQNLQQKIIQIVNLQNSFTLKQKSYFGKLEMYQQSMPQLSQQIERLHRLLQKKQNQNNDLQKERKNIKMLQKLNSTQYQVSVLQFQKKISFLQAKSASLQKVNHQLTQQRAVIGSKIHTLQIKLNQSNQQLQKLKAVFQVRQSTFGEYQKRISSLQSAISQLQSQKINAQDQLMRSRKQLQQNFQKIRSLQFQLDKLIRDSNQQKNQIFTVKQQNRRLRSSTSDVQSLRNQINHLKRDNQSLLYDLNKCSQQKQQLVFQLNQKKNKIAILQQSNNILNSKVIEYQQSIRHIEQANVAKFYEYKQKNAHEYEVKSQEQTSRYNQLLQRYKQLQRRYQKLQANYNSQLFEFKRQNAQLRQHLEDYQNRIFSHEEKIALLSQQIQRLTQQIQKSKYMFQQQKAKHYKSQQQSKQRLLQFQGKQNKDIQTILLELQQTKIQVINLKNMLQQYESINEHTIAERDQLFHITHEQLQEINRLKLRSQNFSKEKDEYNSDYQSKIQNINQIKQAYNQLVGRYSNIQSAYANLQGQYSIVLSQIERLKINNLSQQKFNQYESKCKQNQSQIHRITQQYESALRKQRQNNLQNIQNLQKQARALNIIQQKNNEYKALINRLQEQLSSQNQVRSQIQDLKTQYINIKIQNEQLNRLLEQMQVQMFHQKSQNNKRASQQKIYLNGLVFQNTRYKNQIEQQRKKVTDMQKQLKLLYDEIEVVRKQTQFRIQNIQSHYSLLQQHNNNFKIQIDQLNQKLINQISLTQEVSLEWENKYNTLYQAYNQTYTIYNQIKIEYQTVKQNLSIYKDVRFPQLEEQFKKLNFLVNQLKAQKDQLTKRLLEQQNLISKNIHLQQEIDKQQLIIKNLKQQISQVRIRLSNDNSLQKRVQQHMALMTLRKRVQQTQQQCQEVKRHSLSPFKVRR